MNIKTNTFVALVIISLSFAKAAQINIANIDPDPTKSAIFKFDRKCSKWNATLSDSTIKDLDSSILHDHLNFLGTDALKEVGRLLAVQYDLNADVQGNDNANYMASCLGCIRSFKEQKAHLLTHGHLLYAPIFPHQSIISFGVGAPEQYKVATFEKRGIFNIHSDISNSVMMKQISELASYAAKGKAHIIPLVSAPKSDFSIDPSGRLENVAESILQAIFSGTINNPVSVNAIDPNTSIFNIIATIDDSSISNDFIGKKPLGVEVNNRERNPRFGVNSAGRVTNRVSIGVSVHNGKIRTHAIFPY